MTENILNIVIQKILLIFWAFIFVLSTIIIRVIQKRNKMKRTYLAIIIISMTNWMHAQSWEQHYVADTAFWGGQGSAYDVVQTQDNGYLMAGELDLPTGAIRHYIQLIKTDEQGNEVWRKLLEATYGDVRFDRVNGVEALADGSFMIGGSTYINQFGWYITRIDAVGDTIWQRFHAATGMQSLHGFTKTTTEHYLSLGYSDSTLVLYKADSLGNLVLQKTIDDYFKPYAMAELSNGDYIIVGTNNGVLRMTRTDTQGDTIWSKSYWYSTGDAATAVQPLANNDFLIGGYMTGFAGQSPMVARYDSNGSEVWQTMVPNMTSINARVSDMTVDDFNQCVVTGAVTEYFWATNDDGFLAALTLGGQHLWTDTLNNTYNANGAAIVSPFGNCYVVAGSSSQGYYLNRYCLSMSTASATKSMFDVVTSPNPAIDYIDFKIKDAPCQSFELRLFDATGRLIRQELVGSEYRLPRNNLSSGLYYFGLFSENQLVGKGSILFE